MADGERGEVTLTGGFNFMWPLLRYRTNDYARRIWRDGLLVLVDLEGRAPVLFRTPTASRAAASTSPSRSSTCRWRNSPCIRLRMAH